jgi:hypothetical protein
MNVWRWCQGMSQRLVSVCQGGVSLVPVREMKRVVAVSRGASGSVSGLSQHDANGVAV